MKLSGRQCGDPPARFHRSFVPQTLSHKLCGLDERQRLPFRVCPSGRICRWRLRQAGLRPAQRDQQIWLYWRKRPRRKMMPAHSMMMRASPYEYLKAYAFLFRRFLTAHIIIGTRKKTRKRLYIINGGHRHSLDLFLRRTCLKETMPMSPIDSILGIPGLVVQAVKRTKDIHVWAVPRQRPACVHCAGNQVRIKATHQRTLKHTRQGNKLVVL